jgi:NTP pyrophosphatase (non-canonical NTP hydrolase)
MNLKTTINNVYTITEEGYAFLEDDVTFLVKMCHGSAKAAGWWNKERNVPEMLMLIVSEIAEAMEGHRKNKMDDHLPERPSIEVELADALVRIFDLAGGLNLDLGGAFAEKVHYNQTRDDHKLENRAKEGGKSY